MKRLLTLSIAVIVLAGCRGQGVPGTDPFFGHTRVPPPGTGSISGAPTDPYYGGPNTAPPMVTIPQTPSAAGTQPAPSSGGQGYNPPGGFNYQGNSWTSTLSPIASRPTRPAASPPLAAPSRRVSAGAVPVLAQRERVVQVLQPQASSAARSQEIQVPRQPRASTAGEPRLLRVPKEAVKITDLPPARQLTSAARGQSASRAAGVRPVSGSDGPNDSAEVTAAVDFTSQGGYGHDPDYSRLRGKLEYSQIDRRWKLRYIPVDGTTDRFGGSVVLSDPKVLTGCERGDFVEVQGRLGPKGADDGYAPTYEVTRIKRVGQAAP